MAKLYSIKKWDEFYENAESRKIKNCRYILVPNKQDGTGFGRMASQKNRTDLFAAWILILQVASKCDPRGILASSDGIPVSPEDLEFKTRFPAKIFRDAFDFFSRPDIGWLEFSEISQLPGNLPVHPDDLPANQDSIRIEGKGIEGKGTEGKGREQSRPDKPGRSPDFNNAWNDFLETRKRNGKPAGSRAQSLLLKKLDSLAFEEKQKISIIEQSIMNGWQGFFPLKKENKRFGREELTPEIFQKQAEEFLKDEKE